MSETRSPSRFYCDHEDCGKSFRRAEHLTRHKLNHTDATIPCPQCDKLFYRKDLLHRHLTLKHGKRQRSDRNSNTQEADQSQRLVEDVRNGPSGPSDTSEQSRTGLVFASQTPFADMPVTVGPVNDVLPISADIFQFSSPGVDLAQDWGWLHQSPLPVLPVGPGLVPGFGRGADVTDLGEVPDWTYQQTFQDLFVSQDIYNFLINHELVIQTNRSFSSDDISSILNRAFAFMMDTIPILHRPTFSFDLIPRNLCVSIFCIGLFISSDSTLHGLGCTLLGQTRSELLQHVDHHTIYLENLGVLQAMLLVEFSGMYLADRTAMELSDIFHGTLVTLARRLDLFEMYAINRRSDPSPNDSEGHETIERECAKRLAYFIFAIDVEQALFFGHERSILSIYSMKLELPWEEVAWRLGNGPSPHIPATSGIKFHAVCHNLLSKPQGHMMLPNDLSPLSNRLILLGLSAVVLDLLKRQQDPFFNTKDALARLGTVLPAIHGRLMASPEGPMKTHGRAIYHITVIALCTPLDDLERAANDGFSRTGRTPKQHTRAAIIRLLTKHKVGADPARHAVHLLKLYLPSAHEQGATPSQFGNLQQPLPSTMYAPYEPSALYFGVLAIWAFIIGRVGAGDEDDIEMNGSGYPVEEDLQSPEATGSTQSGQTSVSTVLERLEAAIENDDSTSCRGYWRNIVQHAATRLAQLRNNNAQEYSQVLRSLSDNLSL